MKSKSKELLSPRAVLRKEFSWNNISKVDTAIDEYIIASETFLKKFQPKMRKAAVYKDLYKLFNLLFKARR